MSSKAAHKTRLIEPVVNVSGSRCEIRLQPDQVYYADARLMGIGADGGPTSYNSLTGALSAIKSIGLYDGATPLDTIPSFQQWRAVQALNTSNDGAISVGRYTSHNDIGYIAEGIPKLTNAAYGQGLDISVAQPSNATGQEAWLSLRSVFPFLASSVIIPTNIFRQMRIVIEWNSPAEMSSLVVDSTVADLASTRPLLAIDELMPSPERDMALEKYEPPMWATVVQDSFNLPAQAGTANNDADRVIPQTINQKLRGFNGQYVRDVVVKVTPQTVPATGNNNWPFGALGSTSQWASSLQCVVNGANVMPRQGVEGKMRALGVLSDSIGSIPTFYSQASNGQLFVANGISTNLQKTVGQLCLFALDIEQQVEDFQLTLRRSAVYNNPSTSAAYTINVFGRCARKMVLMPGAGVSDTKYRIVSA